MPTASNPCETCRMHLRAQETCNNLYAAGLTNPALQQAFDSLERKLHEALKELWHECSPASVYVIVCGCLGQADWDQEIADIVDEITHGEIDLLANTIGPSFAELRIEETDHHFLHPLAGPLDPNVYFDIGIYPDTRSEHISPDSSIDHMAKISFNYPKFSPWLLLHIIGDPNLDVEISTSEWFSRENAKITGEGNCSDYSCCYEYAE